MENYFLSVRKIAEKEHLSMNQFFVMTIAKRHPHRKLLTQNAISAEMYNALSTHFIERWNEERQRQKKLSDRGPSYYVLKRMRIGSALIEASTRLMRSGELTTTQAATVLGVRAIKLGNLLAQLKTA